MIASLMLLLLATPAQAPHVGWTGTIQDNGLRQAEVRGDAIVGKEKLPARLRLQCSPGSKGMLSWQLEVERALGLKDFELSDFEGPDAVAKSQQLSELGLAGGLMHPQVRVAQQGYFHGKRSDSFVFEHSEPAAQAGEMALLADSLGPGTVAITWRVISARDAAKTIDARFAMREGAIGIMRDAMAGCGPRPKLDQATLKSWVGRDAARASLFDHPLYQWHAKSLAGRDYDAINTALAVSEPIALSDDLLYVTGRAENGDAAVWLYDTKSDLSELLLIRDGKPKRYADADATKLDPPPAVREFIAALK